MFGGCSVIVDYLFELDGDICFAVVDEISQKRFTPTYSKKKYKFPKIFRARISPSLFTWMPSIQYSRIRISSTFSVLRPFSYIRPFLYFDRSTSSAFLRLAYFDLGTSTFFVKSGFLIGREAQVEVKLVGRSTEKVKDMKMVEVQKRSNTGTHYSIKYRLYF